MRERTLSRNCASNSFNLAALSRRENTSCKLFHSFCRIKRPRDPWPGQDSALHISRTIIFQPTIAFINVSVPPLSVSLITDTNAVSAFLSASASTLKIEKSLLKPSVGAKITFCIFNQPFHHEIFSAIFTSNLLTSTVKNRTTKLM